MMKRRSFKYIIVATVVVVLLIIGLLYWRGRKPSIDVSVDQIEHIEVSGSEKEAFYTQEAKQKASDYLGGLDDLSIYHQGGANPWNSNLSDNDFPNG